MFKGDSVPLEPPGGWLGGPRPPCLLAHPEGLSPQLAEHPSGGDAMGRRNRSPGPVGRPAASRRTRTPQMPSCGGPGTPKRMSSSSTIAPSGLRSTRAAVSPWVNHSKSRASRVCRAASTSGPLAETKRSPRDRPRREDAQPSDRAPRRRCARRSGGTGAGAPSGRPRPARRARPRRRAARVRSPPRARSRPDRARGTPRRRRAPSRRRRAPPSSARRSADPARARSRARGCRPGR